VDVQKPGATSTGSKKPDFPFLLRATRDLQIFRRAKQMTQIGRGGELFANSNDCRHPGRNDRSINRQERGSGSFTQGKTRPGKINWGKGELDAQARPRRVYEDAHIVENKLRVLCY